MKRRSYSRTTSQSVDPSSSTQSVLSILAGFDPKDPASVAAAKERAKAANKLALLKMNSVQEQFVRCHNKQGRMPRTRLFEGANQCLTGNTLVETYFGKASVKELFKWGKPFQVYSWNGKETVVAEAQPVFSKGWSAECFRITLSDGQWIETSPDHLVLCGLADYVTVSSLHAIFQHPQEFSYDLQESIWEHGLTVHASGAVNLNQTALDSLDRYSPGSRLYDERLHQVASIGLALTPLLDDVLGHMEHPSLQRDVQASTHTSTHPLTVCDHLSNRGVLRRFWGRCAEWLDQAAYTLSVSWSGVPLSVLQLSLAEAPQLQSSGECLSDRQASNSGVFSSRCALEYANRIVSIEVVPGQEVFDFTVPVYHNYYAAGLVNHNSGKTTLGVCEDLAHAMGYRPWLIQTRVEDGKVKHYMDDPDCRLRIKVPNVGMVGCEVAGQTLAQRIEPLFKELIPPQCEPEFEKYSDGSMKSVTLRYDFFGNKCGSKIYFRSYVQGADTFEGLLFDWIHWDEPPSQAILNAASRGKMASNAPSWFTMTPLKEPYIYDIFSVNSYNNDSGGTDDEIAIFRCSVWENCQDYCRPCNLAIPENTPDAMEAAGLQPGSPRPKNRCPQCRRILGFMPRAGIDNYLKTITDEDEREAREEGKWKHLSGSVYKKFSKATHTYEDFTIPRDWMRIESVDPADSKPTRWLFGAVSPEDITINSRLANRIYFYAYLLLDGSIDSMVRSVRIKRAEHDYKEPAMVILDAKFGTRTVHTAEAETSWEEELVKAGIKHIVISQSAPGDVALGHKRVKEYLAPHYSKTKGIEFPGMLFAAVGCSGQRSPIQDMSNYRWQEGKDKPEEAFKDFPDCVRYVALEQPLYSVQKLDDYEPPPPPIQQYNPLYYGLSMGGI